MSTQTAKRSLSSTRCRPTRRAARRGGHRAVVLAAAALLVAGGAGAAATSPPEPAAQPTAAADSYSAGVVWDGPAEVLSARPGYYPGAAGTVSIEHVGAELWVLIEQDRGTLAARSLDRGHTWSEVAMPRPSDGEVLTVDHVLAQPAGGYLAIANLGTRCHDNVADAVHPLLCTREQPVVYTSTDAVAWSEVDTDAFTLPSDTSLGISSVIATESGFLAAGTIRGPQPQWRVVLFSSPDGSDWTLERELAADAPLSAGSLADDGTTLALTAIESPCSDPYDSPEGGWYLGALSAAHGRIFAGADIASLTLQQPGDHPLAVAPLEPTTGCEPVDGVPYGAVPYPRFSATLIGGVTTVVERFVPSEQVELVEQARAQAKADDEFDADEVLLTAGTRRYAQLVDGAWVVGELAGVSVAGQGAHDFGPFDHGGRPTVVSLLTRDHIVQHSFTTTGDQRVLSQLHPVMHESAALTTVDDALLLVGFELDELRLGAREISTPVRLVAWRSEPGIGAVAPTCDLQPGGACRFFDLTTHPDYPDFAGRDLAFVDLLGAELGAADFTGANLAGARLWMAKGDYRDGPSFVGSDLTWAQLTMAVAGDISGATVAGADFYLARFERAAGTDFSDANVTRVSIQDAAGVLFDGADWTEATLYFRDQLPDLRSIAHDGIRIYLAPPEPTRTELDLSGVDLTGVALNGPLRDEGEPPLLVITSLTGAILDGTTFAGVDLTAVDPAVDLTELRAIVDSTICPDGAPPDGSYSGTCVRDG